MGAPWDFLVQLQWPATSAWTLVDAKFACHSYMEGQRTQVTFHFSYWEKFLLEVGILPYGIHDYQVAVEEVCADALHMRSRLHLA